MASALTVVSTPMTTVLPHSSLELFLRPFGPNASNAVNSNMYMAGMIFSQNSFGTLMVIQQ